MTFEQFFRILIKRWSLVVICVLFVSLGAYLGVSKLIKPLYLSTTVVEVTVSTSGGTPLNNDNLLASQQLAGTEAQLAVTYPILSQVASHYKGLSADDLTKEVTAATVASTPLFQVNVLDPSPKQAARLANDVAATLIKQQQQLATQQAAAQQAVPTVPAVPGATPVTQPPVPQQNFLVVVQAARPSSSPAQPNKLVYTVAGLLVGLLLGIALAMLLELLDTRISTKEALTQLLDWPVLGTVWRATPDEDIVNPIGHNSNVESYSILRANVGLRANVRLTAVEKSFQTLVVTSGNPGEGKSVVAANLAIFMARSGKNTLLIDANLRRPTLHEQFGIPAHAMGFSNAVLMFSMQTTTNALFTSKTDIGTSSASVVTNEVSLGSFVRAVDIPNLYVMPSGPLPPNPLELLDSKAIQGLFAALNKCGAEVVIFDAPPLLGLSDASILASKVDGTLVVVDITRASKRNLTQVKAQLEQANAHVFGYVVNKQRRRRKDTSKSYGYRAEKRSNKDSHSRKITSYSAVSVVPPTASMQPGVPSQPRRNEPMISMQPGVPSQPRRNEPPVSKQPGVPSQPRRNEPMISMQPGVPSQPRRNEPPVSKQPPTTLSQLKQDEPPVSKQPTTLSQPKQDEPPVSKQPPPTLSQPKQDEPPVSKQPPPTLSQPKQDEPPVSKQPPTLSQPKQDEPPVSKQPPTLSQPKQDEPPVSKQPPTLSQPKQDEPPVSKQPPPTLSQPKQDGQNDGGKHGTDNADSPSASVGTFDDRDQTIIIPLVGATNSNNGKSRRKTGDLREDS